MLPDLDYIFMGTVEGRILVFNLSDTQKPGAGMTCHRWIGCGTSSGAVHTSIASSGEEGSGAVVCMSAIDDLLVCGTSDGTLSFMLLSTLRYCGCKRLGEYVSDMRWLKAFKKDGYTYVFILDGRGRLTIWEVEVSSLGKLRYVQFFSNVGKLVTGPSEDPEADITGAMTFEEKYVGIDSKYCADLHNDLGFLDHERGAKPEKDATKEKEDPCWSTEGESEAEEWTLSMDRPASSDGIAKTTGRAEFPPLPTNPDAMTRYPSERLVYFSDSMGRICVVDGHTTLKNHREAHAVLFISL